MTAQSTESSIRTAQTTLDAYCQGCQCARDGEYHWLSRSRALPTAGMSRENRRAFRTGYQAELVRIANRRMTAEQRDLLIAHDRAVAAFHASSARWSGKLSEDDAFIRADLALFSLNPWQTLGITLGQYQGPAAQAGGAR